MIDQELKQTIFRELSDTLLSESGGGFGFVCIWQRGQPSDDSHARHGTTVAEFLAKPENQYGEWCIDGGWGGPPGPIVVRWNTEQGHWENGGYCGRRFESNQAGEF